MNKLLSDIKNRNLELDAQKILRLNISASKNERGCPRSFFVKIKIYYRKISYLCERFNEIIIPNKFLISGAVLFLIIVGSQGFASAPSDGNKTIAIAQENAASGSKEAEREELEAQLEELEKQIKSYEGAITVAKKQSTTLKGEIKLLEAKIAKTNLQIKSTTVSLKKVNEELLFVEKSLNNTESEIAVQKNILAGGLQSLYEEGEVSLFEILLQYNQLSDFFNKVNSFTDLQQANKDVLDKIIILKQEFDDKKDELIVKQKDTVSLKNIQDMQKKELASNQQDKNSILKTTQGNEKKYQELLKKSQETAAQIRARIYDLLGIGQPITFGEAVKIAKSVSLTTGIRPAFLLSIISQESELGKNVGTCNRAGDPPEKSWTKVMNPRRDQGPFKNIIADLNAAGIKMDINTTPVSCPMKDKSGNYIGWGGAMGPAQFIPSTWILFTDKVKDATGHSVVSPWNVLDSFMASAMYLKDLGAGKGDYDSEWRAAMKYFSGSTNLRYRFYGDNVMSRADNYEDDIKAIGN